MKLRLDLLKHLTAEDIAEEAEANVHRYQPEPLFSKTGTGYLAPASEEDRARELERSTALVERLKARAEQAERLAVRTAPMESARRAAGP